jgi:hypothetical protein
MNAVYEIDQATAASLADVWIKAGMPDAVMVYDTSQETVALQNRLDVVSRMESQGIKVPYGIRTSAQLAHPPMLRSFWVAVLLPGGVQYARVSALGNESEA